MNPEVVQVAAPLAWLVLSLCIGIALYRRGEAFFEDRQAGPGGSRYLKLTGSSFIALGTYWLLRWATPALASEPLIEAYELLRDIEEGSGACTSALGGSTMAAAASKGIELIARCQMLALALPLSWACASVAVGLALYRFGAAFLDAQTRERGRVRRYRLSGAVLIAAAFFGVLEQAMASAHRGTKA